MFYNPRIEEGINPYKKNEKQEFWNQIGLWK